MDDPATIAAKRDGPFLYRVLGLPPNPDRSHSLCPVCKDRCMRVGPNDGIFLFECMKGCCKGSVVDALMVVEGKTLKEAFAEIHQIYGQNTGSVQPRQWRRPEQPVGPEGGDHGFVEDIKYGKVGSPPVLDEQRVEEFITKSHQHLLDNLHLVKHFHRGLSEQVIVEHRIGFLENVKVKFHGGSPDGWNIPAAWNLPITDEDKKVRGDKFHFEIRPKMFDGSTFGGKSIWAPFGTLPKYEKDKSKPRDSYYCLWPHPNTLHEPHPTINTGMQYFVDRIPEGPLMERWKAKCREHRQMIAAELSRSEDDISGSDAWVAMERAFDEMRREIIAAVRKPIMSPAGIESAGKIGVNIREYVVLCPGELKALAGLSLGLMATATTGGEGWIPPPEILSAFAGRKVLINYDNDPPRLDSKGMVRQPGVEFLNRMIPALKRNGATEIGSFHCGRARKTQE